MSGHAILAMSNLGELGVVEYVGVAVEISSMAHSFPELQTIPGLVSAMSI